MRNVSTDCQELNCIFQDLCPILRAVVFKLCRSLHRALDRRLYLLLYGNAYGAANGEPVWHLPEKIYESEETLRKVIISYYFYSFSLSIFLGILLFFQLEIPNSCSVQRLPYMMFWEIFPIHILLEMLPWVIWSYSQRKI